MLPLIDEFINYLNVNFGKENMNKCKDFILRLKKSMQVSYVEEYNRCNE